MDYYGTPSEFSEYHTLRGRDVSEYASTSVIAALIIASEWLDGSFRHRFPGYKVGMRAQEREWPRTNVHDSHGYPVSSLSVPIEIEQATYEAAYRHLQEPGSLQVDFAPNKYKRVSIEGAVSVEYQMLDAGTVQKRFPVIGQLLDRLLGGGHVSTLSSSTTRV